MIRKLQYFDFSTLKVRLVLFQFAVRLPLFDVQISCCHWYLEGPLMITKPRGGNHTSTFRPVRSAFAALPDRTLPSSSLISSWNRIQSPWQRERPQTGSSNLKFSIWADIPWESLYSFTMQYSGLRSLSKTLRSTIRMIKNVSADGTGSAVIMVLLILIFSWPEASRGASKQYEPP